MLLVEWSCFLLYQVSIQTAMSRRAWSRVRQQRRDINSCWRVEKNDSAAAFVRARSRRGPIDWVILSLGAGRRERVGGILGGFNRSSQHCLVGRSAELGAAPSVGSVGDSYDNALAETVIGLYKSELIRGPRQGPWDSAADVELATLGWVHWHNHQRLHTYLGDVPPAESRRPTLPYNPTTKRLETINRPSRNTRAVHF